MEVNVKGRNYGIDLLRIVAMFMVIILHILGRGGILSSAGTYSINYYVGWLFEIASFGAVNCYAIISGYVCYNKKIRYSNLISIIFCAVFYVVILTVAGYFATPDADIESVKYSILHIRTVDGWWYLKAYFAAFFVFPFINLIVEKYDKKKLYIMLIGMFIIFSVIPTMICSDVFVLRSGYSPWWLLIMYFVGAVIKKYDIGLNGSKIKYFCMYLLMVILLLGAKLVADYFEIRIYSEYLITYVSPFVVLSSVFLVMIFRKIKMSKYVTNIIAFMSPLTFGIYLIHTQYYVWEYLDNRFVNYVSMKFVWFVVSVIFTAVIIYLVCSIIEFIRQYIFRLLNKLYKRYSLYENIKREKYVKEE